MVKLKTSAAKSLAKALIEDKNNSNNLPRLVGNLENESDVPAALIGLHTIFLHLIDNGAMSSTNKGEAAEDKYSSWLREMYADVRCKLCQLLTHSNTTVQQLVLNTLMKLVKAEGHKPIKTIRSPVLFPASSFTPVVRQMVCSEYDMTEVITRFQEYTQCDDVRYHTMKTLLQIPTHTDTETSFYLSNMFTLLQNLSMPALKPDDDCLDNFLSKTPDKLKGLSVTSYSQHQQLFSQLWLHFLQQKLTTSLYKKVLVMLHDVVIPHLENPLLLSDFLTTSYNIGGAISLLALNGVFILVNQYNLDYPDFYKKLYGLLQPEVFYVKYRARFFYLLDLFLTSTHLPSYLVAAFIKRLARLSLTAPPHALTVIIPLIYNLLIRHPSCKVLLHRDNKNRNPDLLKPSQDTESKDNVSSENVDSCVDLSCDPFLDQEPEPVKCRALESSLWELSTLEQHYLYSVSGGAGRRNQPMARMEVDIAGLLETTVDGLIGVERKKKVKAVSTTFEAPVGLFGNKEDQLGSDWVWE